MLLQTITRSFFWIEILVGIMQYDEDGYPVEEDSWDQDTEGEIDEPDDDLDELLNENPTDL